MIDYLKELPTWYALLALSNVAGSALLLIAGLTIRTRGFEVLKNFGEWYAQTIRGVVIYFVELTTLIVGAWHVSALHSWAIPLFCFVVGIPGVFLFVGRLWKND